MLIEFCCFSHSEYLPNTDWFWFGVFSSTSTGIQLSVREREIECLYYFIDVIFFSWILVIFIFHRINLSSENDFSNDFQTHKIHSFLLTVVSLCMELDFFLLLSWFFMFLLLFWLFVQEYILKQNSHVAQSRCVCFAVSSVPFRKRAFDKGWSATRQFETRLQYKEMALMMKSNWKASESKATHTHTHPAHAWQKDDRNGNKERKKNYGK